jgi:hypothetical protein
LVLKKKNDILSLKTGDKIFGIRLSFGPHRLQDPKELDGKVDIMDYCYASATDRNDGYFHLNISYHHKDFGLSVVLNIEEYINEYYYLNMDYMKSGYDAFYTLKPETWKSDIILAHTKFVNSRYAKFQEYLEIYNKKLKLFTQPE